MPKELKTAMTTGQHVALLRSRGMSVDEALAQQWFANVSYYRLSAYWYPARVVDSSGVRGDAFRAGTDFEHVTSLYEADRKLRTLVHDGMERIEVSLRARVGQQLYSHGSLAHTDPRHFRPTFNHARWLETAHKRIDRAAHHNESIKHYRDTYGQYPFWVLAEVLDFADVSRLLEGLPAKDQLEISEGFGVRVDLAALSQSQSRTARKTPPLVRWMEQLTIIRNTCAHHARLWNKSFTPAPTSALRTQPELKLLPAGQSERLFGALVVMARLLRSTSPGTTWPEKVVDLLDTAFLPNPLTNRASLGMPEDWVDEL